PPRETANRHRAKCSSWLLRLTCLAARKLCMLRRAARRARTTNVHSIGGAICERGASSSSPLHLAKLMSRERPSHDRAISQAFSSFTDCTVERMRWRARIGRAPMAERGQGVEADGDEYD